MLRAESDFRRVDLKLPVLGDAGVALVPALPIPLPWGGRGRRFESLIDVILSLGSTILAFTQSSFTRRIIIVRFVVPTLWAFR